VDLLVLLNSIQKSVPNFVYKKNALLGLKEVKKMEKKNIEKSERAPLYNSPVGSNDAMSTKYCSVCGTRVNSSDMYCGNCGYILEGIQNSSLNNLSHSQNKKVTPEKYEWKTILKGALLAIGISFSIGFITGFLMYDVPFESLFFMAFFVDIISLFIGGLYAGIKAKKSGGTHGAYVGAVSAIISLPINLLFGITDNFGSLFFGILWAMLFAGIGGLVGYRLTKSSKIQPQINTQTNYV
jgi:putative membrane protein (TIGR04086 family)